MKSIARAIYGNEIEIPYRGFPPRISDRNDGYASIDPNVRRSRCVPWHKIGHPTLATRRTPPFDYHRHRQLTDSA
jgi:hypothetical protein